MAAPEPGRRLDLLPLSALLALVAWLHRAALRLPLRNADDWFHLDVALGMGAGDPAAFHRAVVGYGASDTLRPAPYLLWALDAAAFGTGGAGYYATNLGLHLLIVAGVYALARSLGAGLGGATIAGAVVGLNIATGQGTYYLAARDDQLMVAAVLGLMLAWPRLRSTPRGRWLAAGIFALACLCKPPALAALPLLWLLDRRASPLRAFLPLAVVAGAYVGTLALLLHLEGGPAPNVPPSLAGPVLALRTLLAPGSSLGLPWRTLGGDLALWLLPLGFSVAVGVRRGTAPAPLRFGALWLLATLPIPLYYLSGHDSGFNDTGRQMLLPSVGLALLACAAAPREGLRPRLGLAMGAVVLAAFAGRFSEVGPPFLDRDEPAAEQLLAAVRGHAGPLVVAVQRPDAAVTSLLTSGVLGRLVAGPPPTVTLQGGERALRVVREPYGYGRLVDAPWPRGPALAEDHGPPGEAPTPWPRWTRWEPLVRQVGEVAQRWSFRSGPMGWTAWPPASEHHLGLPHFSAGEGFVVETTLRMPEGEVASQLAQAGKPGILLSPPLEIPTDRVCALELELRLPPSTPPPPHGAALIPGGRFALVTWSERVDQEDAWRGVIVAPVGSDGHATARLDRSPAWTDLAVVRRLGVLPRNQPGSAVIEGLSLRWCR